MRVNNRNNHRQIITTTMVLIIILVPVIFVANIFNTYTLDAASWSIMEGAAPDPSTFQEKNETFLEDLMFGIDERYAKYHLPLNQSSTVTFENDTYEGERYNHYSDNEALWTGIDFVAWTFKYLTNKQEYEVSSDPQLLSNMTFAFNTLINMTTAFKHMAGVANGGIGPEFGAILARGYAPNGSQDIWTWIYDTTHHKHFNGTNGKSLVPDSPYAKDYSNWRYRAYTSNDEYGGFYLFLAICQEYLFDESEYIKETVSLIIEQFANGMLNSNFLGIHGTGALSGVNQKPMLFSGGYWAPLLLKMASKINPEKYEQEYLYYVSIEMYYLSSGEGSLSETLANYYAYNFGYCVVLAFLITEDSSTQIWQIYYEAFLNTLYKYTRYHRNAWFNAIFLLINQKNGIDDSDLSSTYSKKIDYEFMDSNQLVEDINDQLMRYGNSYLSSWTWQMNTSVDSLPANVELINPVNDFIEENNIPEFLVDMLQLRTDDEYTSRALTLDYREQHHWIWEKNPFVFDDDYVRPQNRDEPSYYDAGGMEFSVPYWMMRYMGYLQGGI